ncbi:MAG TPA: TIGR03936 family radical SAM-associated protein [Frankiaceae bacterium]|nr:TIGR03936 family radical SAM-associated protein [Frankiaceae bacterium]
MVARLRLRYAKRGRLRFLSHRDVARAFERAVRRADVPIAYSAGFTPHPKISWVGAAPTGAASEAEYVELGLAVPADPQVVRAGLDASLPPGLDVLDCVPAGPGSLADRIDASAWRLSLSGVTPAAAAAALAAFLACDVVEVERRTKDGRRSVDARGAVASARPDARDADCAILDVVVRHTTPAVRPEEVLAALRAVAALEPPAPVEARRLAQGLLDAQGSLADPLAPDRRAAGRPAGTPVA